MTKNWFLSILGVLVMMITTTGCQTGKMNEVKVPGNPSTYDYAIVFRLDRDLLETGTFSYGPEGSTIRKLGNRGRSGYELFFDLTMDFRFKDGREYHEKIDIRPLILEMVKNHEIHDLTKTKWGGDAQLNIKIERNRLTIEYQVSEYIKKENPEQMFYKHYSYPVFEKTLD